MGKKNKHSKDKLHKTVSELKSHHVGVNRDLELSVLHRRLKFDSCCLSLNTISGRPVGLTDDDGFCYMFEHELIVKFLEKYHIHPITGSKVTVGKLIDVKFHMNNENQYHCPVIYKIFNQNSKIVANKKTGHVYSFEAYQQLNLKANNFKDLLTDEIFEKDDIVWIQDPAKAEIKWLVTSFYHIKNKLKLEDESAVSKIRDINQSAILRSSLEEYNSQAETIAENFNKIVGQNNNQDKEIELDKINSALHSDGVLSRSVTSTSMPVACSQKPAILDNEQILYPRIRKKGYVQLVTNFGPLNLELYCDRTPKTCHNFLLLAKRGYYDNTIFHRLIQNFILQGGDPTGTGSGGQSAWGEPFRDECYGDLKHSGRGVLAMANSGPNTNKSQFYITIRGAWDHLDGKHTVFGRVVGGDETLGRIEDVEVDKKDKPKKEIKILHATIYVDPFEEVEKALEEERKKNLENKKRNSSSNSAANQLEGPLKRFRSGIGSYINLEALHVKPKAEVEMKNGNPLDSIDDSAKCVEAKSLASKLANCSSAKKRVKKSYGDFSDW